MAAMFQMRRTASERAGAAGILQRRGLLQPLLNSRPSLRTGAVFHRAT